jgi:two-component system, cell cycle response regulator
MAHSRPQDPDPSPLWVEGGAQPAFQLAGLLPRKILVVDDEEAVRRAVADILRLDGYDVCEAGDGHTALQHMEQEPFELVVTDLVMPAMDGLTLVKMAQQRGYRAAYIVMTGFASMDSAVEAMKLGAADYLPKPFPLDLLRLVVARTLEKQQLAERARQAEVYEKLAHTDGLTELYNYRFFQRLLSVEMSRAQRFQRPLSLIMLDVDDFKMYNDVYGHQAGDQALRQLARLLRRSSRSYDLVARYGGDEFVVILPETNKKTAAEVAERIRTFVEKTRIEDEHQGLGWHITASLGIASFPEDAAERADLIRKADQALYHAKTCGRNRTSLYGELDA